MSNNSNKNRSKKGTNNSMKSILGLNSLRNSARKLGSNIESGIKGARNTVSSSIQKATDSVMPEFVGETIAQDNNTENTRVGLGNLLVGQNNGNKKNKFGNVKELLTPTSDTGKGGEISSNIEKISNDIKKTAMNTSALAVGYGWFKYVLLFFILLFLGVNIFSYLAKTSTYFANITEAIFKPIANLFGFSLVKTVEKVVDTSAEGAKYGIDLTKDAIDDVLTLGQAQNMNMNNNENNRAQNNDNDNSYIGELDKNMTPKQTSEPEPTDSSNAMANTGSNKGGYCYVGVDRGYRSCVKIADGEKCMSGKIFPTKQICVNPSLRN